MELIIIAIYFTFFCLGFKIYDLPRRVGMSMGFVVFLFATRILFGCINLYFHNVEYLSNDAHHYFEEANYLLADFPNRPSFYINDWLFNWGDIRNHLNFLNKDNAVYWSDVGRHLHLRYMVLCNILSFGHEYANVIFYNVIFFIGQLALYKAFVFHKPNQKWLFIIVIFFVPSVAFWCSGIHKDGFILALVGMVAWSTIRLSNNKNWKNYLLLLVTLIFLLAFRYFYFLVFLPFYILYWLMHKKTTALYVFAGVASFIVLVFLFSGKISSKYNLLALVVNKQEEFLNLKGYSDMQTPILQKQPTSFIKNLPSAFSHIFIEPLPRIDYALKYAITAMDSLFVLFLIGWALWRFQGRNMNNSFILLFLFYSLFCLIFIGYTIPNLGALVRYESPFICLLLLSLFAMGDASIKKLSLK